MESNYVTTRRKLLIEEEINNLEKNIVDILTKNKKKNYFQKTLKFYLVIMMIMIHLKLIL